MKYLTLDIPEDHAYIIPIGDCHFGDKNFSKDSKAKLKGYCDWVMERDNARIFLMGDIFNTAGRNSKTSPFESDINEYQIATDFFKPYASKIIGAVDGNHECFDDKTELLTSRGYINQEEIKNNEIVLTKNIKTGLLEWQKIKKIHRYNFNGEINNIKSKLLDLSITDDHRMILRNQYGKYRISELSKEKKSVTRKYIPVSGLLDLEGINKTNDEIAISAWFLAEGWYHTKYNYIRFAQRKEKVNLITNILDRMKIKYSLIERKKRTISILGKIIKKQDIQYEVHILGKDNKKIKKLIPSKNYLPSWVFKMNEKQTDIFIKNYILADGSIKKEGSMMIYSSEKNIVDELQTLLITNGYRASVSEYRNGQYRINITKRKEISLDGGIGRFIKKRKYNGIIWCVTTPNDTVFVRRNGIVSCTGNCRMYDEFGISPLQLFCRELNIPYCKYSAMVRVRVNKRTGKNDGNRYRQNYFLYAHHSTGGGGTVGGKLNRAVKLRDIVEGVDVLLTGHNHQLAVAPQDVFYPSNQGGIKKRRIWYVNCGSYLDWDNGYAEKGMLAPTKLGSPRIRLSGGDNHDCHISI